MAKRKSCANNPGKRLCTNNRLSVICCVKVKSVQPSGKSVDCVCVWGGVIINMVTPDLSQCSSVTCARDAKRIGVADPR